MHEFTTPLWQWEGDGPATWFFVSVPDEITDEIRHRTEGLRGGFGSVKVEVTVGDTTWRTSLFPSKAQDTYILPMKKAVRQAEALVADEPVTVTLSLVGF